jgi:hypothetical protein
MADLKDRDTLRLIHARSLPRPPEAMIGSAIQLERALAWRDLSLKLRRIAAVVTLIGSAGLPMGRSGSGSRTARRPRSRRPSSRTPCTRTRRLWYGPAWSHSLRLPPMTRPRS